MLIGQTRQKLDGVIATIDGLMSIDYPFTDPVAVLRLIRATFETLRSDFIQGIEKADEATIKTLCKRVQEEIQNYLPILGFIERSSDLEAPVELHGPVLRLTRKAIHADGRLIIFSEWDYSPFTFLFPELTKRGVVLVGMPRSESQNALIGPLAGHELGHNIWQKGPLAERFTARARELIIAEIAGAWDKWKDDLGLTDPDQLNDLVGLSYLEIPLIWSARQAEEVFCDFVGLLIFREAYLYSFRYLLAPGDSVRSVFHYPSMRNRAGFHAYAAKKVGLPVPEGYEINFDDSTNDADGLRKRYAGLADQVCKLLIDELIAAAQDVVSSSNLSMFDSAEVARIRKSLRIGVPATNTTGLENIMIAAWQFLVENAATFDANVPAVKEGDRVMVLNELVLKTMEVNQIEEQLRAK